MTEIRREIINHPAAWTPAGLGGKDALRLHLTDAHFKAIDGVLARTTGIAPTASTRAHWDHPALNPFLANLRDIIMDGAGIAIVTGITPERYDEQAFERIYWGFGTHLGNAVEQSQRGDLLGYVQAEDDDPLARGYRSSSELEWHTDSYELAGLMCVRSAQSGGLSRMASTLTIHNEMLRTRPDLLEALYEGYYLAISEMQQSARPLTERKIPAYCSVDGTVSCMFPGKFMHAAAKRMGVPLPPALAEACELFRELAERPDIGLQFLLEPGEMMIFNNFTNTHARTAFKNAPDRKRLLLRLWLEIPHGRPVAPELWARAEAYSWIYEERRKALTPA